MNTKFTSGQQLLLDIYRIIAAFLVLIGHSFSFYQISFLKNQDLFPYIQNIGVIMFFLLSGFLTTYSLSRKNENRDYSFCLFTKHKIIRIIKEYFPGLILILIIDFVSININNSRYIYYNAYNIKQFIGNLFMLQGMALNYIPIIKFVPFGSGRPLWTLAIEWWFYLLYRFMFLTLANKNALTLKNGLLGSLLFLMPINYLISGSGNGLGFVFGLGVFGFYIYDLIEINTAKIIFPISCVIYILYGFFFKEAYTVYSFLILWVSFCCLMKIGSLCKRDRNATISFISQSTFMLYLIHYSIIDLIYNCEIVVSIYIKFLLGIIISVLLSFIMYYIFGRKNLLLLPFKKIKINNLKT